MTTDFTLISAQVGQLLQKKQWRLTTAESCTGGYVAQVITSTSGSSEWFERGFVTYSNEAKQEMLGVQVESLKQFGAVSEQVAKEMAQGALLHSHANISLAITGIAGPLGGTLDKPVGLVWFAFALSPFDVMTRHHIFTGERQTIREQAVSYALNELISYVK